MILKEHYGNYFKHLVAMAANNYMLIKFYERMQSSQ